MTTCIFLVRIFVSIDDTTLSKMNGRRFDLYQYQQLDFSVMLLDVVSIYSYLSMGIKKMKVVYQQQLKYLTPPINNGRQWMTHYQYHGDNCMQQSQLMNVILLSLVA